jgi:hypothetical protein
MIRRAGRLKPLLSVSYFLDASPRRFLRYRRDAFMFLTDHAAPLHVQDGGRFPAHRAVLAVGNALQVHLLVSFVVALPAAFHTAQRTLSSISPDVYAGTLVISTAYGLVIRVRLDNRHVLGAGANDDII